MVQRQGRCVLRVARRSIESDMQAVVDRIYFIPCAISVKENNAEGGTQVVACHTQLNFALGSQLLRGVVQCVWQHD